MADEPISDETAKLLRSAWFRYLETVGETRPALYRYCRRMTGNIWDAEDLLQDTLLRGFGRDWQRRCDLEGRPGEGSARVSFPHRKQPVDRPDASPPPHHFRPRRIRRFHDGRAVDPGS
jgi:hypothetical protein